MGTQFTIVYYQIRNPFKHHTRLEPNSTFVNAYTAQPYFKSVTLRKFLQFSISSEGGLDLLRGVNLEMCVKRVGT